MSKINYPSFFASEKTLEELDEIFKSQFLESPRLTIERNKKNKQRLLKRKGKSKFHN